jgi:hypothetical protein
MEARWQSATLMDWTSGAPFTELPETFFHVVVLSVHGHTHQRFDHRVRSCRIVCNLRGYP